MQRNVIALTPSMPWEKEDLENLEQATGKTVFITETTLTLEDADQQEAA